MPYLHEINLILRAILGTLERVFWWAVGGTAIPFDYVSTTTPKEG